MYKPYKTYQTKIKKVLICCFAVGGSPRVSKEHAAGDGHSRDLP